MDGLYGINKYSDIFVQFAYLYLPNVSITTLCSHIPAASCRIWENDGASNGQSLHTASALCAAASNAFS